MVWDKYIDMNKGKSPYRKNQNDDQILKSLKAATHVGKLKTKDWIKFAIVAFFVQLIPFCLH